MYLEKRDVSLYYEVRGQGAPLLLIHGVMADAGVYARAADILAKKYKVITFDRRGNSRSRCDGERTFSLDAQAEDMKDLLDTLQINQAYIIGSSAGAVIGCRFLERYPERVRHMILYEPALLGMVRTEPEIQAWIEKMGSLVAGKKYSTALMEFVKHIGGFDERSPQKDEETSKRELGNLEVALHGEMPGLTDYLPDISAIKTFEDKITIARGEKSGDTVYARIAGILADRLGKKVIYYPGYHNLPYDLPEEFAVCVHGTLQLL